jgi:primosomal protein N'
MTELAPIQRDAVDVLVDSAKRQDALSYLVPDGVTLQAGDAVEIPYGKRVMYGMVLGPSQKPELATREVLQSYGRRANPRDLEVASLLAERHFADARLMLRRVAPTSAKGAPPISVGPVALHADPELTLSAPDAAPSPDRLFVMRDPRCEPERLAAFLTLHALRNDPLGQVLILCPTTALVERTLELFASGAARLDASASRGAWRGFLDGTVQVGVGTRSAMLYSAKQLSAIIVVDTTHPGHTPQQLPYVSSIEASTHRAAAHHAHLYLTGVVPSALDLSVTKLASARATADVPVVHEVISRKQGPARRIIPPLVLSRISRAVRQNKRVLVVLRDSSATRCATCRDVWRADVTQCVRCGSVASSTTGWNAERLAKHLHKDVRVAHDDDVARHAGIDLLVLLDADSRSRRATLRPEFEVASYVKNASSALSPTGAVLLVSDDEEPLPVLEALRTGADRAVARSIWQSAKAAGLPPFKVSVEVLLNGKKNAPDTSQLPGRVLGPQRRSDSEWRIVVMVDESELPLMREVIERWRQRYQLRVKTEG